MSCFILTVSLPSGDDGNNSLHTVKTKYKLLQHFALSRTKHCFRLIHCPQQEEPQAEPTSTPGTVDGSQEGVEDENCKGRERFSTEEQKSVGGAIERLGLELLEKLPTSRQQPNIILSPFSVALALAQLMLGW